MTTGLMKREGRPKPRLSIFCALSQNYQHFLKKKKYASYSILSKKLKNGIKFYLATGFLIKTTFCVFCSRTQEPHGLLKF